MKQRLPLIIAGAFVLCVLGSLIPLFFPHRDPAQFDALAFASLPILSNGRIQPIDSLARNSLLQLRQKQAAQTEPWSGDSKELTAAEWIMEVMMKPETADTRPVFRIDNPDCKGLLGLPIEADKSKETDGKHFAWNQIKGKLEALQNEARRVEKVEPSNRTPYDQSVARLWNGVGIYMRLENALEPQNARDWPAELNAYLDNVKAGVAAARAEKALQKDYDRDALDRLANDYNRFDGMSKMEPPMLIPPPQPEVSRDKWERTGDALMDVARGENPPFAVFAYARMAGGFRDGRVAEFNQAVEGYRNSLEDKFQPELKKASHEQFFNGYQPFYKAMYAYVLAFVLVLVFWLNPYGFEWARKAAFWLVVAGLGVHISGLLFRMILEGRPPVTNLYSSAIFIGFGAVVLGLVLEGFWRNGIGLVKSSMIGFITLIIAHHLSLNGDTMEMMRAVLDTNFWLATHVVIVTLGYASTFVAGFLGLIYIVFGVFTPMLTRKLTPEEAVQFGAATGGIGGALKMKKESEKPEGVILAKSLPKMVYGIVCFAALFSFVGTVLGGIWADQSWGRFWGWDPKENGALIIVLWNALILHARWGGMVRERGLMCLAVGGNIVTSWSWFGVNMLGIGLHSYGFTDAAFRWLMAFVGSQLIIIAIGLLPLHLWTSFRTTEESPAPPPGGATVPA